MLHGELRCVKPYDPSPEYSVRGKAFTVKFLVFYQKPGGACFVVDHGIANNDGRGSVESGSLI